MKRRTARLKNGRCRSVRASQALREALSNRRRARDMGGQEIQGRPTAEGGCRETRTMIQLYHSYDTATMGAAGLAATGKARGRPLARAARAPRVRGDGTPFRR